LKDHCCSGENVLVLGEIIQARRGFEPQSRPIIKISTADFEHLPGGIILADAFRDCIRVILRAAISSPDEDVRPLTTHQLLCDLIRFAAGWSHSFWREHYPLEEGQVNDHHHEAWKILRRYVESPLLYCPEGQPMKTRHPVRLSELKIHTYPCTHEAWRVVTKGTTGHATIRYD